MHVPTAPMMDAFVRSTKYCRRLTKFLCIDVIMVGAGRDCFKFLVDIGIGCIPAILHYNDELES